MVKVNELKNVTIDEIQKSVALLHHKAAYKDAVLYNLPYRVMLDYWEGEWNENDVPINPYYPFECVPDIGIWHFDTDGHYTHDEWIKIITKFTGERNDEGKPYITFEIPKEIQALIDEKGKPYRLWDLGTAAGFNTWIYFFMVFLMPYETKIQGFTMFDMYGDMKHSEQDLKERKAYYTELIERCKAMPELYKHDIQIRSNPLDILYHERDMIPNYDLEREDTNTRAYRIGEVLKLLETAA